MTKVSLSHNQKEIKQHKLNYLEVYPLDKKYQIPLFNIKKIAPRFSITKGEKTYIFSHAQNLEQAQNIFELIRELNFENSYFSKIFLTPVAVIRIEKLNYFSRPSKVYFIGLKNKIVEEVNFQTNRKKEKNKILGSCIFNLAKLHERLIALGDVSLANIYKKITDNTAVFGSPAQLRIIKSIEQGYDEFALFLCNLKHNKIIKEKEVEIYIEHYTNCFEKKLDKKEKQKIMDLYERYYNKYYV